jgi:hypothetical protein
MSSGREGAERGASAWLRRTVTVLVGTLSTAGLWTTSALAHDFDPGVLVVAAEPGSPHRYRFKLTQPTDTRKAERAVRVRLPPDCSLDETHEPTLVVCAEDGLGLEAPIAFEGLTTKTGPRRILVTYRPADGGPAVERIVATEAPFFLGSAGPQTDGGALTRGFGAFVRLGAEHLLQGADHLAFLIGLVALVTNRRSLFLAITAFSLGHALSLGLSVSGLVHVPTAPTEALIAISVLLVAREALVLEPVGQVDNQTDDLAAKAPTLLHRAPFVASLLFGLVHGLGFASALGDRGFPRVGLFRALAAFHLGIEGAQLLVVGALFAVWAALCSSAWLSARRGHLRTAGLAALGCLGAAWSFDRVALLLSGR